MQVLFTMFTSLLRLQLDRRWLYRQPNSGHFIHYLKLGILYQWKIITKSKQAHVLHTPPDRLHSYTKKLPQPDSEARERAQKMLDTKTDYDDTSTGKQGKKTDLLGTQSLSRNHHDPACLSARTFSRRNRITLGRPHPDSTYNYSC